MLGREQGCRLRTQIFPLFTTVRMLKSKRWNLFWNIFLICTSHVKHPTVKRNFCNTFDIIKEKLSFYIKHFLYIYDWRIVLINLLPLCRSSIWVLNLMHLASNLPKWCNTLVNFLVKTENFLRYHLLKFYDETRFKFNIASKIPSKTFTEQRSSSFETEQKISKTVA